jgi:hypothetical protein
VIVEFVLASFGTLAPLTPCTSTAANFTDVEEFERLQIVVTDYFGGFNDVGADEELMSEVAIDGDCDSSVDREVLEYVYVLTEDPPFNVVQALAMCPFHRWVSSTWPSQAVCCRWPTSSARSHASTGLVAAGSSRQRRDRAHQVTNARRAKSYTHEQIDHAIAAFEATRTAV